MKTLPLLLILVTACLCDHGHAQSSLEPCQSDFLSDYYTGLDTIIDDAIGKSPRLSITKLPSFHAESGVRLVGTDVYFVRLESSFWADALSIDERTSIGRRDFSNPDIQTKTNHAPLAPGIVHRVVETYTDAIATAKDSNHFGLDGVSYHFSTPESGCGQAWSPDSETYTYRLVELSELLAEHAILSRQRDLKRSEQSIIQLLNVLNEH